MSRSRSIGIDELMIVNPGPAESDALFLGEDGTLYQVQGSDLEEPLGEGSIGPGDVFLGEDGTLYRVVGRKGGGET